MQNKYDGGQSNRPNELHINFYVKCDNAFGEKGSFHIKQLKRTKALLSFVIRVKTEMAETLVLVDPLNEMCCRSIQVHSEGNCLKDHLIWAEKLSG